MSVFAFPSLGEGLSDLPNPRVERTRLHYVLDVSLKEDACWIRKENGAENRAVLRHIALNLMQQAKTCKHGIKAWQKKAGWDNAYLEQVLVS